MKSLGGWLLLLVVVAGTGYAFYILKLSGSSVASYPIELDGSVREYALEPVALEPSMNPVRVNLSVDFNTTRTTSRLADYEVTMRAADGRTLWHEEGSYRQSGSDSDRRSYRSRTKGTSVKLYDVEAPGEYQPTVTLISRSGVDLEGATLEVRRNVATVDLRIVVGLALVGVLGLVLAGRGKKSPG